MKPVLSLKARALRYLSQREHSRAELQRKLARYACETDDINTLLNQLEQARLLSEERFSEALIRRRAARYGNQRIVAELRSHGLDVPSELDAELMQNESQRARDALQKKFHGIADEVNEKARQIRFLQQRGFSSRAIREALEYWRTQANEI